MISLGERCRLVKACVQGLDPRRVPAGATDVPLVRRAVRERMAPHLPRPRTRVKGRQRRQDGRIRIGRSTASDVRAGLELFDQREDFVNTIFLNPFGWCGALEQPVTREEPHAGVTGFIELSEL